MKKDGWSPRSRASLEWLPPDPPGTSAMARRSATWHGLFRPPARTETTRDGRSGTRWTSPRVARSALRPTAGAPAKGGNPAQVAEAGRRHRRRAASARRPTRRTRPARVLVDGRPFAGRFCLGLTAKPPGVPRCPASCPRRHRRCSGAPVSRPPLPRAGRRRVSITLVHELRDGPPPGSGTAARVARASRRCLADLPARPPCRVVPDRGRAPPPAAWFRLTNEVHGAKKGASTFLSREGPVLPRRPAPSRSELQPDA